MQPNPYKLTSQVSLAPDPQLSSMMEKFKQIGDAVSFSVVFNEVQRRKEVRNAAQSKMMGGPKPQVAEQLIQEAKMAQMPAQPQGMGMGMGMGMPQGMPPGGGMPPQGGPQGMPQGMPPGGGMPPQGMPPGGGMPPQGLPEQAGIGQLPAPNMQNMAGGGIVSFAGDDDSFVLPNYYPDEGITSYAEQGGDVTAPITPMGMEKGKDEEDPYPRMDIRDAVGEYRAEMDKLMGEQEADYKKYEAERDKFGPAYANAEAREREMNQQYEDEARVQSGLPWLAAGAALMGSSTPGLGGISEAIGAALPVYTAGRDKLSGLKDKQREFMQTVAEARRAEGRGDTDKLYALKQSMAAQKANIAATAADLGLKTDQINATLAASMTGGADNVKTMEALYVPRITAALAERDKAVGAGDRAAIQKAEAVLAQELKGFAATQGAKGVIDPKAIISASSDASKAIQEALANPNHPLGRAQLEITRLESKSNLSPEETEKLARLQEKVAVGQDKLRNMIVQNALTGVLPAGGAMGVSGAGVSVGGGPDLDNPPWAN